MVVPCGLEEQVRDRDIVNSNSNVILAGRRWIKSIGWGPSVVFILFRLHKRWTV